MIRLYLVALCFALRVSGQQFHYVRPAPAVTRQFVSFPTFRSMNMYNPQSFSFIHGSPNIAQQFRTVQHGNIQTFSPHLQRISTFTPAAATFPNPQFTGQSSHVQQLTSHGIPVVGSNANLGLGEVSARALPPSESSDTWKVAIPANFRSLITSSSSSAGSSQSGSLFTGQEGASESQFIGQSGASIGTGGHLTSGGITDTGVVANNGLTSNFVDHMSISGNGVVDQSGFTGTGQNDGFSRTDISSSSANNIGINGLTGTELTATTVIKPETQNANLSIKRKASSKTSSKSRRRLELKMKLAKLKAERAAKKAAKRAAKKAALEAARKAKLTSSRVASSSTVLRPPSGSSNRRGHTSFTQTRSSFTSNDMSSLRNKLRNGEVELSPEVLANLMSLGKSYGLDDKTTQEIIIDLMKSMNAETFNVRSSGFTAEQEAAFKQLHQKSLLLLASIAAQDAETQPSSTTSHSITSTNHQLTGARGGHTNNFVNILMGRGSQNGNSQGSSSDGTSNLRAEEIIALLSQLQQSTANPGVGSAQEQTDIIALLKQLESAQVGIGEGPTPGSAGENAAIQSLLIQLAGTNQMTSSAQGSQGQNNDLAALLAELQRSQSGTSNSADTAKGIWEQQVLADVLRRAGSVPGTNENQHLTNNQITSIVGQQPSGINGHSSIQRSWSSRSSSSSNSGRPTDANAETQQTLDLGSVTGEADLTALLAQLQLAQTGNGLTQGSVAGGADIAALLTQLQMAQTGNGLTQGSVTGDAELAALVAQLQLGQTGSGLTQGSESSGADIAALLAQLQVIQNGNGLTQGGSAMSASEAELARLFEQLRTSANRLSREQLTLLISSLADIQTGSSRGQIVGGNGLFSQISALSRSQTQGSSSAGGQGGSQGNLIRGQQLTGNGLISQVSTLTSGQTQGSSSVGGQGGSQGNSIHGTEFWKSQSGSSNHVGRTGHQGQQLTGNGLISQVSTLTSGQTQGSSSVGGQGGSQGNSIHGTEFWKSQSGSSNHVGRTGHQGSSTEHVSTSHGSGQGLGNAGDQGTVSIITTTFTSQSGSSGPGSGTQNSFSNLHAGQNQGIGRSSSSSSSSSKTYVPKTSKSSGINSSAQSSSRSSSGKLSRSSKSSGSSKSRSSKSSRTSKSSSERKSSSSKRRRTSKEVDRMNRRQGSSKSSQYILLFNKGERKKVRLSDLEAKLRPLVAKKSDALSEHEIQEAMDEIIHKLREESMRRMKLGDGDSFHLAIESTTLDGNRQLEFDHPTASRAGVSGLKTNQGGKSAISNFEPSQTLLSTLAALVNQRDAGGFGQGSTNGAASASKTANIVGANNSGATSGVSKPSGFLDSFFSNRQGQTGSSADPQYTGKISAADAFKIAAMSSLIGSKSVSNKPKTSGPASNSKRGSTTITAVTTKTSTKHGSTAGSPGNTNSGSKTSRTSKSVGGINGGAVSGINSGSVSGSNQASANTIGMLDLSGIGANEPTQQAKQTANVKTQETIITNTGISTSQSNQRNRGIGSLDLSGVGPTRNIPASSSNQGNRVSSTSSSQSERFVASQNNQGATGTVNRQNRITPSQNGHNTGATVIRHEQSSSSHANMIGSAGGPTSHQEPNPRPYRPTDTVASTAATGRNETLASAITDMITSNNAVPTGTHTTTSIKVTTKGNTGLDAATIADAIAAQNIIGPEPTFQGANMLGGLSAAEPIYPTNTVSGANGGAAHNSLDQTSRTAAALTDIISSANSQAGPNHSNKMASSLADLIAISPHNVQGTGSGGANTNSHSSVVSMFSRTHSSGSGHEMAGHGPSHNMVGASQHMAGGFQTNPDFNMAVSSSNGQATQGVNLPSPPAERLLHVPNPPPNSQIVSGVSSMSTGERQTSSGSAGTRAFVEITLPESSIANQAFNFPITATSGNALAGSPPASSGLQNDMMISIAELSGKLINSQSGLVESSGSTRVKTDICVTPDCIRAATEIKASRDLTANPCEDFYQYTCGGWLDSSPIRPDQHSRSVKWDVKERVDEKLHKLLNQSINLELTQAEQKAIMYYKSCINKDAIETLGLAVIKPLLNDFGGWPVLESNWQEHGFKLESVLSTARKYTVDTPIFIMAVETDPTFPEQNIIHIEQPHLGMPDRTYYLTDSKEYKAYVTYMLDVVKVFGADPLTAAQDVKDVVEFEAKLANLTQEVDYNQDPSPDRRMTIDQLMQTFPGLDWKQYIYNIFSNDQVRIPIHSSDLVLISNPQYIRDVIDLLRNTSARVTANYINWMMLQNIMLSLPSNVRQLHQKYTEIVPEVESDLPRWQQCVKDTNKAFGLAVARLFVNKHFDSASKQEVMDMFAKTKSSMRSMLERESWMDQATKTAALEKLDALQARIGYPEEIRDIAYVNKRYNRITVTPDSFFQNTLNIMSDEAADNLRDMAMPSNLTEWDSPPPAAKDIIYELDHNVIALPAGVLQSPYFHKNYPRYLNYGAIGFIIGHKITHAFDDVGSRYSKTGRLEDWWSNYTRTAYGQKAECFVKQYDGLTVTDALSAATLPEDSKLNGKLTLQENIADNGGLKESFTAYTQWAKQHGLEQKLPGLNLEPDQLFFINFGRTWCGKTTPQEAIRRIKTDIWADARNRINTVVKNNPNFSNAFSCAAGSPMNPAKKCAVW